MTTAVKVAKKATGKKVEEPKKISKTGKAMRAGVLKGSIIELVPDPWNTGKK